MANQKTDLKRVLQHAARKKGLQPGTKAYDNYVGGTLRKIHERHQQLPLKGFEAKEKEKPQPKQLEMKLKAPPRERVRTREAKAYVNAHPGKSTQELIEMVHSELNDLSVNDEIDALSTSAGEDIPKLKEINAWIDTSDPSLPPRKSVTINGENIYRGSAPWTELSRGGHNRADSIVAENVNLYGVHKTEGTGGELEAWLGYLRESYKSRKRMDTRQSRAERAKQAAELKNKLAILDGLKERDVNEQAKDASDTLLDVFGGDRKQALAVVQSSWDDDDVKRSAVRYLRG